MVFAGPTVFGAQVDQHPQQRDALLLEERQYLVVADVGGRQGILVVIELGEGPLE